MMLESYIAIMLLIVLCGVALYKHSSREIHKRRNINKSLRTIKNWYHV